MTIHYKLPKRYAIETTNYCNMSCLYCDQRLLQKKAKTHRPLREQGNMSMDDFIVIFNKLKKIRPKSIDFDLLGEPLLNLNTLDMVKMASEHGIETFFSTNCSLLSAEKQRIFESGLSRILLSFDGMTKETYEKYRIGGNFDEIKNNIMDFMETKRIYGFKKPHVTLSFLVFKWNEHEIDDIKDFCKENKINNLLLKYARSCFSYQQQDKNVVPIEYLRSNKVKVISPCSWAYDRMMILWNGDVTTCCQNVLGNPIMGNLLSQSLEDIWDSERRLAIQQHMIKRYFDICRNCADGTNIDVGKLIKI